MSQCRPVTHVIGAEPARLQDLGDEVKNMPAREITKDTSVAEIVKLVPAHGGFSTSTA